MTASLCPKVVALYSKWAAGATALQLASFNFPCRIELCVLLFRAGRENGNVAGRPWIVGRMNTTKGHMPIGIPEVLVIFTEPARPPLLAWIHNTSFLPVASFIPSVRVPRTKVSDPTHLTSLGLGHIVIELPGEVRLD